MELHLSPDLEAKVSRIAEENGSPTDVYVRQLVESYLDHDAWFRRKVKRGMDQLDRGEYLSHEQDG